MGVGDDEADVVHDSADVRNVVVDAFQFQKNGSHSLGAFGDLDVGGLFNRLTKSNAVREARIAGNTLCQIDRALHRQLLETLFDSLVYVKHAQLQVENGLAGNREIEMARLDDAGVNRAYGKLKHAFAQGGARFFDRPSRKRTTAEQNALGSIGTKGRMTLRSEYGMTASIEGLCELRAVSSRNLENKPATSFQD